MVEIEPTRGGIKISGFHTVCPFDGGKDEVEYMEITDTKYRNGQRLPVDETALENYIKSCINGEMLLMEEVPLMILRHCMDANMGWIKGFEKRTIEAKTVFLKKSKGKKVTIHVTLERNSTNL